MECCFRGESKLDMLFHFRFSHFACFLSFAVFNSFLFIPLRTSPPSILGPISLPPAGLARYLRTSWWRFMCATQT